MSSGVTERRMVEVITEQAWLEPIDRVLGQGLARTFAAGGPAGQQVKNFLHGTWLGHPLHAALTDAPLGAWTTALVLDALDTLGGWDELAPGADAAVAFGVVSALGAAAAGLTDWSATGGRARKVGLVHGLLNVGVTAIYGASFLCRRRGARGAGRALALTGFALATYTASLGGELVYRERIGVDHSQAPDQTLPADFVPVMAEEELREGQLHKGEAGGVGVLVVRRGDRVYALADSCSHLGCSLADGQVEGDSVRCPCHGSRFALADGRVLDGPATLPQPTFAVRVRAEQVEVRATGG